MRKPTEIAERVTKTIPGVRNEWSTCGAIPHDVLVRFLVKRPSRTVQLSVMQAVALVLSSSSRHTHVEFVMAQVDSYIAVTRQAV